MVKVMDSKMTKLGIVNTEFETFVLREALVKNDAGEWGDEPSEKSLCIIRSTNFTNEGRVKLDDVAYRTLKPNKVIEKTLYPNNILIERSGGSDSQPVGRVLFVDSQIGSGKYAFANFIQRISIKDEFEAKYIYYCLQQMYEVGITTSMQNQTTGIRNLDWKFYTKTILPKPLKPEQKAIATILSKVDAAIESVKQSINATEKLKKAMMQNLLTGKLKPDGTWRTEEEFYVDEKFGKIPNGWIAKPIGDKSVVTINPNYKFSKNDIFDFIPMDGVNDCFRGVKYIEKKRIDNSGYTRFKNGDILFAKITPCTENGKVTIVTDLSTDLGFASTEFIVFSPSDKVDNKFYYYLLSSDSVHKLSVSLMEGTTGRQRVPWKVFKNRIFTLFPNSIIEQKDIVIKIQCFENKVKISENKLKKLEKLKKSLMQHLLTGKKRLTSDAIKNINQN